MKTWRGHINKTRKGEERLKCPFCNAADTKVIDSRPADDNSSIRRRRQCETCGKRFTTYEKLETIPLMVVKKDNTREMYDRAKIEAGILHSCHKRPVSQGQISALIDDVENNLFNREEREISTAVIGELAQVYNYQEYNNTSYSAYYHFSEDNPVNILQLEVCNQASDNKNMYF